MYPKKDRETPSRLRADPVFHQSLPTLPIALRAQDPQTGDINPARQPKQVICVQNFTAKSFCVSDL